MSLRDLLTRMFRRRRTRRTRLSIASEAIESRTLLSGFSIRQSVIAAPELQRIRALDVAYFSDGSVAVVDGYEYFSDSSGVSEDQAGVWRLSADGEPVEGFGDSGFVLQPGDEVFSRYQGSGRVERYDPVLNSVAVGPGDELIVGATHRHEQATINNTAIATGSSVFTFDASGQYDVTISTGHSYVNIEPPDRWPYYVAQSKRINDIGFTTDGKRMATGGATWFASSPYYEGSPKWVGNALFTESLATPTNAPAPRVPQRGEILRSQLTGIA